jgi:hypothetical protein
MAFRLTVMVACLVGTTNVAAAEILWGVNGHPITAYPGIGIDRQLDYIRDLGMKSYRVNISDADRAPELADLVKEAKTRGIEILPVITAGNVDLKKDSTDELYGKARTLAVALGSRFKDDIRVWELGNEMENFAIIKPCEKRDDGTQYPCEWGPAGGDSALDYYGPRWEKVSAVLKGLSDGMTEVDSTIRKAIGTAGWGHVGAFERIHNDGIKWDISVWHTYGEDPEWAFEKIARYNRPIWVTEFNNPYGSQRSERQQAEGLKQAMARLQELQGRYKVEAAHIYELLDETYWAPSYEAFMGLVRLKVTDKGGWTTGEPKPAYFAVRDLIRGPRLLPKPQRDCSLTEIEKTASPTGRAASYGYCLVLGRVPDADGSKSETGVTGMMLAMLHSDEFSHRHATFALTDRAYISFLYLLLLDREADQYGLDSYGKALADGSVSRAHVALGIMESSEFKSRHPALFQAKDAVHDMSATPPG